MHEWGGRSLTRNMEAITRAPCKARHMSDLQQDMHFQGHMGLAGVSEYRHAKCINLSQQR